MDFFEGRLDRRHTRGFPRRGKDLVAGIELVILARECDLGERWAIAADCAGMAQILVEGGRPDANLGRAVGAIGRGRRRGLPPGRPARVPGPRLDRPLGPRPGPADPRPPRRSPGPGGPRASRLRRRRPRRARRRPALQRRRPARPRRPHPPAPPQDQRAGHRPGPVRGRRPAGRGRDRAGDDRAGHLRRQLRQLAGRRARPGPDGCPAHPVALGVGRGRRSRQRARSRTASSGSTPTRSWPGSTT